MGKKTLKRRVRKVVKKGKIVERRPKTELANNTVRSKLLNQPPQALPNYLPQERMIQQQNRAEIAEKQAADARKEREELVEREKKANAVIAEEKRKRREMKTEMANERI